MEYFGLTNKEEIIFLGEYPAYNLAYEDVEYNNKFHGINVLWIFSRTQLDKLHKQINHILMINEHDNQTKTI